MGTAWVVLFLVAVLAYQPCSSRSMPEDSVVSVYTTQPTTAGTHPAIDVYHQIANNIAERITSPIYRFLGIGKNKTVDEKTTRKTWENIELLDDPESVTQPNSPEDNEIEDRDIEELSDDAVKKTDRRPEKVVLYSSYLPVLPLLDKLENLDSDNETATDSGRRSGDDDDEGLTLDDVEQEEPRDGYFIYILELIGSFIQLVIGGVNSLFKPKPSES